MADEQQLSKEEARRQAVREAAFDKAKKVHDEYEEKIDELKQRRVLVDRECSLQIKESNEAVTQNNYEIVRLTTLLDKAAAKEIKLSMKEKSDMQKQLKERRANQETLMYAAMDLQDEYKEVMQQITDEIKALREEQADKEVRAKYSGQYLKDCIQTVISSARKPYRLKDVMDNHYDLRRIDSQKIALILNQMVLNGELVCEETEEEKYYSVPTAEKKPQEPEDSLHAAETEEETE